MTTWDPTCFPAPIRPARVVSAFDCSCDAIAYMYGSAQIVNPNPWAPITLQITVATGASPVQNWRIKGYRLPDNVPCPVTATDVATVEANYTPVLSLIMPSLPAGATVVLDGVRDRYELTTGGNVLDARRFVFSEGGRPFRLPVVEPCERLCLIILANACNDAPVSGAGWLVSGMATLSMVGAPGGSVAPGPPDPETLPLLAGYSMRRDTNVPASPQVAEDLIAFGGYPAAGWDNPGWLSLAPQPVGVGLAHSMSLAPPFTLGVEQTSTTRTPVHQLHVAFDISSRYMYGRTCTLRLPFSSYAPGTLLNDGPGGASGPTNQGARPYMNAWLITHYDLRYLVESGTPPRVGSGIGWLATCYTKPAAVGLPSGFGSYLNGMDDGSLGGLGYFASWDGAPSMAYLGNLEETEPGVLTISFDVDGMLEPALFPGAAMAEAIDAGVLGIFVGYLPPALVTPVPKLSGLYTITGAELVVS